MSHSLPAALPPANAKAPRASAASAKGGKGSKAANGGSDDLPLKRLPTLQRNALRKLFDRNEFTPEEVAALSYRRLQQAEGIGQKGLDTIAAWLQEYGFQLAIPEISQPDSEKNLSRSAKKSLEAAIRMLRTHGYEIHRAAGADGKD